LNKRQRKKAKKKRVNKLIIEMAELYLSGMIGARKFLMSTWDEEYPPYQTKINP
jgi:hypothetical protein